MVTLVMLWWMFATIGLIIYSMVDESLLKQICPLSNMTGEHALERMESPYGISVTLTVGDIKVLRATKIKPNIYGEGCQKANTSYREGQ